MSVYQLTEDPVDKGVVSSQMYIGFKAAHIQEDRYFYSLDAGGMGCEVESLT